ncbi:MAG: hypothetical protein Q7V62_13195, partial [Actinomycetota bacterium]|nr:hypothetical protein [Actinomycetota bacterium]
SVDVLRADLYMENDAEHGEWFKASICHETNTLDLPVGTCQTRVGFMFFFGVVMVFGDFQARVLERALVIEVLHIADFCACHEIVKNFLAVVAKMDLPLQQTYDLGRRYKNDALMKRAADAFVEDVTRADTPETQAMLVTMWPVYRERLQGPSYTACIKEIRAAIQAYFDSVDAPTTLCTHGACPAACTGAATPGHVRRSLECINRHSFDRTEHPILERIATALGM